MPCTHLLLAAATLLCLPSRVTSDTRDPPAISTEFTTSIAVTMSKLHHGGGDGGGGGGLRGGSSTTTPNTGHLPSTSSPPHSDTPFTFSVISSQRRNATYFKMVYPPSGLATVTLYSAQYSMECYVNNERRCLSYCPLGDFPFEPLTLDGFTDEGPVLLNGTTLAEKWRQDTPSWDPFSAFASFLYVNQSNYSSASPLLFSTVLSAFDLSMNQTFNGWSTAPIPGDAFNVDDLTNCPMSRGCSQSSTLREPLAAKLLRLSALEV